MADIWVKDKEFNLFISEETIYEEIINLAENIKLDLKEKDPLFICILNGTFMFASDLMKQFDFPCEVCFIRLRSYTGTNPNGKVKKILGLVEQIKDRHIVIVEDIIDTGYTMHSLVERLKEKKPASLRIAVLLLKPKALQLTIKPDYVVFEIPNDFIVGYGMDYEGHGRNLRDIYKICD
jgi:hypoxanthine phosphoribosyltransferase